MSGTLELPLIDLFSTDRAAAVQSIRQACLEYGFFYLTNHGIDGDLFQQLFSESKNFFRLPLDVKLKLEHNEDYRGYTPPYSEKLDPSSEFKDILPLWRGTMKSYYEKVLTIAKHLSSLVALSLNLDEHFFGTIGAPMGFLCLLHYPEHSLLILGTCWRDGQIVYTDLHCTEWLQLGTIAIQLLFSLIQIMIAWWNAWRLVAVRIVHRDFHPSDAANTLRSV